MAAAPVNTETLLFFHLGVDVERPEAGREASKGEILSHQLVQELVLAHSQSYNYKFFVLLQIRHSCNSPAYCLPVSLHNYAV